MADIMEIAVPFGVGAGDGLSDAGLEYIDKATGNEGKPLLKKPSTIGHLAISAASGVASYMFLGGNARLMGFEIAGRHLGKVGGEAAKTYTEGGEILGGEELELEEEDVGLELDEDEFEEEPETPTPTPTGDEGLDF